MHCVVRWSGEGMAFVAESGSGHRVHMDGAPEAGGRNLAARPMEVMLIGAGGCTAFDVVLILQRGRHDVSACEVALTAQRAERDPKVFTDILMTYTVRGRGLARAAVERAVALSHQKYCSATIMLAKTAVIRHEVVVEEG